MDVRRATTEDIDTIRSIAHSSLTESYSHFLSAETIEAAIEQWYGDSLMVDIEDEDLVVLIAESDDGVLGFSQSEILVDPEPIGQIQWLHVDPRYRREGFATRLLSETRRALEDEGVATIRASVLEENELGTEFYERNGFHLAGTAEVEIGEETFIEQSYIDSEGESADDWRGIEAVSTDDSTVFVSYGEPVRGSRASFYSAYLDREGGRRYGWYCGNCDSIDNAMDSMGRIECNVCGNRRKATRWDASYL